MAWTTTHYVKTWKSFFRHVWDGSKTFEIRENDREYTAGDILVQREFDPAKIEFTGRQVKQEITYVTNFKQIPGWVVMATKEISRKEEGG